MIDLNGKRVVISRTDSIGDVMLSLPMCAWIKEQFPGATLIFLGKNYTESVVEAFAAIDEFVDFSTIDGQAKSIQLQQVRDWNADVIIHVFPNKTMATLAKATRIPVRVGTSHRNFHLLTCNHRINFTRKRSSLHESQLNFNLLRPFGLTELPSLELLSGFTSLFHAPKVALKEPFAKLKNAVILHPKSQGSAVEWPIEKYLELARLLIKRGEKVVFTGTEKEGEQFRAYLSDVPEAIDSKGQFTLEELIVFISQSKALVACSTGPLHIAGFLGIRAIGLFASRKPIHPGRWKALGPKAESLVFDEACETCKKGKNCRCIQQIAISDVLKSIELES